MRRSKGETLLTLLERNDKNIPLESVAEYLAFIHATLPADPVKKPASSSAEKALTPLVEKEIISQEELSEILHSYSPIDTIMKKAIFVFNKDAHPGNWVLTPEGKITAIDFDERSPIPQTYDLAKLCEHTSQITWEQKEKVIQRYITSYNNYTRGLKIRNHEEFIEEYLHSTLQKAFQFTRGWGENQEKSFYALKSLENALKAIGLIQEKSADPSYKQLEKSLFKIYQKFSGADEYRLASQASNDDKIRQDGSA